MKRKCISLVDDDELKRIYLEIQEKELLEKELMMTNGEKFKQKT